MPSESNTFLGMTNRVLRRLNDVPLTTDNFTTARGIQATIKDAVVDAIRHINRHPGGWPWNAVQHTMTLSAGTPEYAWPLYFKSAEWRTFQIQKDDTLGAQTTTLKLIDRDVWYHQYRGRSLQNESSWDIPRSVFESHGNGFGVYPTPDKDYEITFRYYSYPVEPEEATDEINIPEQWHDAVFYHALSAGHSFKENEEQAQRYDRMFKETVEEMAVILLHRSDYFRDTRVNF